MPFHPKPSWLRVSCPSRSPNCAGDLSSAGMAFARLLVNRQEFVGEPTLLLALGPTRGVEALCSWLIRLSLPLPPCIVNCRTFGRSSHHRDSVPHICSKTSMVLIHTLSRNPFLATWVSRVSGSLPLGQGASPFFLIQAPMAGLRNSGQLVQNVFVTLTGIVSPSISTRTTFQFLSKNRSTFSRPALIPRATAPRPSKLPLFQPETSITDSRKTCLSSGLNAFSLSFSPLRCAYL